MTNYWGIDSGAWRDNYPIGVDVEKFILENPQWVLYMRKDPRFTCPDHRHQATLSPIKIENPCSFCYGFGVKVDPIIVPCRVTLKEPNVSYRETDTRSLPGWLEYFIAAVDFPRAVRPKLEDQVVICSWDKRPQDLGKYPRARAVSIESIYVIKQINDYFEREISHFGCGLEAQESDLNKYLMHLPILRNVEILNFDPSPSNNKYSWTNRKIW